ncbi:hypothetical protein D3C85_758290 [compost metagenome]
MRERQVKPARDGVHRRAHIAALRQQADHARPGLRRRGLEHRRKRRVRLRVQVGETHAVGPGHGHAALRHEGFQFVLQAYALTARFRKTRRIDDGRAHALGVAAAQHGRDVGRGNRQHRQVHRFGHGFNVGPAALAEHFLVLRVDRIDAARVAKARQQFQRHAADTARVGAGADHRDGMRIQQAIQRGPHAVSPFLLRWMACARPRSRTAWNSSLRCDS